MQCHSKQFLASLATGIHSEIVFHQTIIFSHSPKPLFPQEAICFGLKTLMFTLRLEGAQGARP